MWLLLALQSALRRHDGQTLVEYALIMLLVAIALVASLGVFKDGLEGFYNSAAGAFP